MAGLVGVIVSLLVALLVALSGTARAGGHNLVWQEVPPGSGLCSGATWLRSLGLKGVGPRTNIAVFKVNLNWEDAAAEPNYAEVAMPSANPRWFNNFKFKKVVANLFNNRGQAIYQPPIKGHSEQRLLQALQDAGIPGEAVEEVCSQLEPCENPVEQCKATMLNQDELPNLKRVTFEYRYPNSGAPKGSAQAIADAKVRKQSVDAMAKQAKEDAKAVKAGKKLWDAPDETPESDGLPKELTAGPETLDPGGIDFSSLQLRYLSLSGPHQGDVQYSMDSDGAPVTTDPSTGLQTAQEDSAAFFTWLTLPTSTFWVNLSPNSPPNIIDPRLALTDAGRVLLQSDLLLKGASAAAQNPATPTGAQLWQSMLALPPGSDTYTGTTPCVAFRLWIVPDVATVHATKTQLYILSAPLKVKMAVVTHLPGQLLDPICPLDAWNTTFQSMFRQLILPQITQEVNTAPQWEPLRRIYMSRVAAQWVRQEAGPNTVMGRLVDSGLHRSWIAQPGWSPTAIWQQYLQEFNAAPTAYTVPVTEPNGTTVNATVYVNGGVNFKQKIHEHDTSNRQFKAHWRGLAAAAKHSTKRPSSADGTTLVGGGTTERPRVNRNKQLLLIFVPRGV